MKSTTTGFGTPLNISLMKPTIIEHGNLRLPIASNPAEALKNGYDITQPDGIKRDLPPGWKTTSPPKDGSHFIAIGRIIAEDEFGCTVSPYLGEIWWGGEYWMYSSQSWPLSVTCSPDETFYIDFWIELPNT